MTLLECQRDASPHPRLQLPLEGSLDTLAAYAGDTARYIDRRPWIESAYGRIRAWPPRLKRCGTMEWRARFFRALSNC